MKVEMQRSVPVVKTMSDDFEIVESRNDKRDEPKTLSIQHPIRTPYFGSSIIQDKREDGYWVETFHFHSEDRVPGIVASGLVSGLVEFLDNPIAAHKHKPDNSCACKVSSPDVEKEWPRYEIAKYNSPVACAAADITGNGLMDLIVCHNYGPFMLECDPKGGQITWLENPGRDGLKNGHWKERLIGRWPAMHRIKVGHFTQRFEPPKDPQLEIFADIPCRSYLEVVAASVVYGPHDKTTPIPIIRFQAPELVTEAVEWHREIIDDENFTVIHEVTVRKLSGSNDLDSMLVSSREGLTWLHYSNKRWHRELITIGEPKEARQSFTSEAPGSGDHWGTGCADVGRVGADEFAYIASLDPFHGTSLCVYTKEDQGLRSEKWKRHILDVYGTPNQKMKWGDGPGHYIVCADFDGDGDDEILLSIFGSLDRGPDGESIPPSGAPNPNKGIMYYKPLDLKNGVFARWKIAEESSARIALGNFGGKGLIDLVSVRYNVKRYYEEPNPNIMVHLNKFAPITTSSNSSAIVSTLWDNEGMVYLPDPQVASFKEPAALSLIEIANYEVSVEVYPKNGFIFVRKGEGIKVVYGSVNFVKEDKHRAYDEKPTPVESRSPFSVPRFSRSTTTSDYSTAYASENLGAIILRMSPNANTRAFPSAGDVPVSTRLNLSRMGVAIPPLKFKKVDTLWWGKYDSFFRGVDFFNLTGFHLRFLDSKVNLAHVQFWTAGSGVNCGVHNHTDNIFSEIHVCLSAGTKTGGMSKLKKEYESKPVEDYNKLGKEAFDHLELRELDEHGGMWERDVYGKPVRVKNNVVKYPWHKWQAGKGKDVDVWMAIEFNPDL